MFLQLSLILISRPFVGSWHILHSSFEPRSRLWLAKYANLYSKTSPNISWHQQEFLAGLRTWVQFEESKLGVKHFSDWCEWIVCWNVTEGCTLEQLLTAVLLILQLTIFPLSPSLNSEGHVTSTPSSCTANKNKQKKTCLA